MALTKEEAQKALAYIQTQLEKQEFKYDEFPQSRVRYVKNQKSSSANAEKEREYETISSKQRNED